MALIGPEGRKQLKLAAGFLSAGFELAITTVVGYFAGQWLDGRLGTTPTLSYVGLILGIIAGFRTLFQLARNAQKQTEPTPPEPPDETT